MSSKRIRILKNDASYVTTFQCPQRVCNFSLALGAEMKKMKDILDERIEGYGPCVMEITLYINTTHHLHIIY